MAIISKKDGRIIKHSDTFSSKQLLHLLTWLAQNGYVTYDSTSKIWNIGDTTPDQLWKIRSKPGKRIYRGYKDLNINDNVVVRTSSGFKWGHQAKLERKGGEILFKI